MDWGYSQIPQGIGQGLQLGMMANEQKMRQDAQASQMKQKRIDNGFKLFQESITGINNSKSKAMKEFYRDMGVTGLQMAEVFPPAILDKFRNVNVEDEDFADMFKTLADIKNQVEKELISLDTGKMMGLQVINKYGENYTTKQAWEAHKESLSGIQKQQYERKGSDIMERDIGQGQPPVTPDIQPGLLDNQLGSPGVVVPPAQSMIQEQDLGGRSPGIPQIKLGKNYGPRADRTQKGSGWLGELKMKDGSKDIATEISISVGFDGKETLIPLLVPSLTKDEVDYLLRGNKETTIIKQKAIKHAIEQMREGKSPFIGESLSSSFQPIPQTITQPSTPQMTSKDIFILMQTDSGKKFLESKFPAEEKLTEKQKDFNFLIKTGKTVEEALTGAGYKTEELSSDIGKLIKDKDKAAKLYGSKSRAVSDIDKSIKLKLKSSPDSYSLRGTNPQGLPVSYSKLDGRMYIPTDDGDMKEYRGPVKPTKESQDVFDKQWALAMQILIEEGNKTPTLTQIADKRKEKFGATNLWDWLNNQPVNPNQPQSPNTKKYNPSTGKIE